MLAITLPITASSITETSLDAHVSRAQQTNIFFLNVFLIRRARNGSSTSQDDIYTHATTYKINKHKKGHAFDLKTFFALKRIYHCEHNNVLQL